MANPQCEDGYTKIANELLEAFARIRISGEARQVLDVILRKTYGFGKREDAISLSQFHLATGLSKSHICDSINKLKIMNVITEKGNDIARIFSINKDYSQWKPFPKKGKVFPNSGKEIENSQQIQGNPGDESIPEKGNDCKNVPEKGKNLSRIRVPHNKEEIYSPNSVELRMSELLLSLIRQRNPGFKQPDLQTWASHVDKMIRLDKRLSGEIEKVAIWCQSDGFWQNNVLSTQKLREKFDVLFMKMTAGGNGQHVPQRHRGVVL